MVHEWATAVMADRLGDKGPRMRGRRTLDPRPHMDPLGSYVLPAIFVLAGFFGALMTMRIVPFAYGRRHDLNPHAFRDPKVGTILTSLVGPASTLVLALIVSALSGDQALCGGLTMMLDAAAYVLVTMTVVELVPLPGRDGGRILQIFLPPKGAMKMRELSEHDAAFVILFLVILGPLASRMVGALLGPVLGNAACLF